MEERTIDLLLLLLFVGLTMGIGLLPKLIEGLSHVDMVSLKDFPGWKRLTWKQKLRFHLTGKIK